MAAFHICETKSISGIAHYARDFHELVLGPLGYVLMSPNDATIEWIDQQAPDTSWHLQLGGRQFEERKTLARLCKAGARKIDVTLHDPPFLTFPFFPFSSPLLMQLSRGFDWYLGTFGLQHQALRRLRNVFVLTEKGKAVTEKHFGRDVCRIPHIVHPASIWPSPRAEGHDIIYLGFIGPAKGLDYALILHQRILDSMPQVKMHVIGKTSGASEQAFLESLKQRYKRQVTYHGYVPEEKLDELFGCVRHVFLPFRPYKYLHPASGNVINGLKRGRVVWSTAVNSVPELIQHGENGLLLTGELEADAKLFIDLTNDPRELDRIGLSALATARNMSSYPYAKHFL